MPHCANIPSRPDSRCMVITVVLMSLPVDVPGKADLLKLISYQHAALSIAFIATTV